MLTEDKKLDLGARVTMQPERLREIRKGLGLTQADFAERIGLSRKSISDMEGGRAPIEKRTALAALWLRATGGDDNDMN